MEDIQQIAITNYQINLEFFKQNHETLYNKLNALETLLDEGRYPQKYDLEYKDGYFDIIELSSGHFLYNTNSKIHAQELSASINFKKDAQVITNFYNYTFAQKALDKLKNDNALTTFATTAPITHYHDTVVKNSMEMIEIQKFIFLGLGLGCIFPILPKKQGQNFSFL